MTPRFVLTALLLASAPAARALPEEPAPCRYGYATQSADGTSGALSAPSKQECDFLAALEEPFAKLAAAAGLTGKASLSTIVTVEPAWNAYAAPGGVVRLNDKFVKKWLAQRPVAITVLAHELGHVVQERDGEAAKRTAVWRNSGLGREWNDFNRKYEGQADTIGGDLLSLAGFPADLNAQAAALKGGDDYRFTSNHTHPAEGIRWLEALKRQEDLKNERYEENLKVVRGRMARARVRLAPAIADPNFSPGDDPRTPMEWAATDPGAAKYRNRKPYAAPAPVERYDGQGRPPMSKSWQVTLTEPPLSAAPAAYREDPGVQALSLSERLALRARVGGAAPESYAAAVWDGAWDWAKEGLGLKKAPAKGPAKP